MLKSYYAFIRSVLLYGFPSFCNAPQVLLNKLVRVERRIFKIIFGGDVLVSPDDLLSCANTTCRKLLFAATEKSSDHPFLQLFVARSSTKTRCTRSLDKPLARTKRFSRSFIRFCE